jgi:hypothetical protein
MFYGQGDSSGQLTPAQLKDMYLNGKVRSTTLDNGESGYYDPATNTTYDSQGRPVVDKAGYGPDGTPFVGDALDPKNIVPGATATDSKGNKVPVGKNSTNGQYFYYDEATGEYVHSSPTGQRLDSNNQPVKDAQGNIITNNEGEGGKPGQSIVDYYNNNPPPQFNQQAIDDQINAAKQQRALQGGQDTRSLMALGANSGTNPDAVQANIGAMSADSNAQGAASDAKLRMQGELTKLQQETKWYDDKAQALQMQAAMEANKDQQAALFIQAQLAASAAASRQEDMMKLQIELSKPSVGEMIGGGFLSLLTGGLSGGLGRLIGGLGK